MLQLADLRSAESLPDMAVWSHLMKGTGVPGTPRVHQIIDAVAVLKLREFGALNRVTLESFQTMKDVLKDVFVDISQNPRQRCFTNRQGINHCLATSSQLYSYGADRMLLPFELLLLQGHRRGLQLPSNMRSNQIKELAGEGMSLPCLGTVVWSAYMVKGLP